MTAALVVMRRELRSFFCSPLAWAVLTLFLLVQGWSFYLYVQLMSQPSAPHGAAMQYFFGGSFLYWLFVIVVVATLTMRLIAEERRSGTLETLLAAPVSEAQVIVGKYLATVLYYAFLWAPTVVYVTLVYRLSGAQRVGWGGVASGYLGTLLVGASCIAIGLWVSTLVRHQIVAALATFALLSLLLLLAPLEMVVSRPALKALLAHVCLFDHMEDFARGIIDSRHVVFHASLILLALAAATKSLEVRRWR
jgi:ABC-2 type transport system permease protein